MPTEGVSDKYLLEDDYSEHTKEEIKGSILIELGYKASWSYLPKDAMNSLWAYITGEFAYSWDDGDLMEREDMMLMIGSLIDEYEFDDHMTKSQLIKIRELMDEVNDQREWT